MKKTLIITLVLVMALTMLVGCGNNNNQPSATTATVSETVSAEQSESVAPSEAGVAVKTGLGMVVSVAKSTSAADGNAALAEADIVMAAVTLDADGKIVGVKIDMTQSKVNFDAAGQLTTDIATEVKTKVELGDEYGMASASGIGKEWYEQIAALEDWMTGKTIDEVNAMQLDAEGKTAEADLVSSVTIHVSDYIKAVDKAVANAKDFGAAVTGTTKTGLGTIVSLASSKSATADAAGLAQTDNVALAVTVDETGMIVGVMIDTAQVKINVDATGAVTTDLTVEQKTKDELGSDYGMSSASSIGKDWYEEAAALAQWMVGKTIDEVSAIQLDAEGKTTEADLVSSVTIHVSDYIKAAQKAVANAG